MAGLISRVCPGGTKCSAVDSLGTTIWVEGGWLGTDYRQRDRLCMQDDKANFRPRSLHFVILNNIMEISAD